MPLHISSTNNPRIKNLIALQKAKERKLQNRFIAEGVREVSLAQSAGFKIIAFYICESIYRQDPGYPIDFDQAESISLDAPVYSKIAYRDGSGGVVAEIEAKPHLLAALSEIANPLYLLLDRIEKPGNIGAMLRTADAAGIDAVILSDPITDIYNPNVIRSSLGTVFTMPIAVVERTELIRWLSHRKVASYAASLQATKAYFDVDFSRPSAILMGSESAGLSQDWENDCTDRIIIPMRGKIDSMNVSNSAAVIIFEAIRQRSRGKSV